VVIDQLVCGGLLLRAAEPPGIGLARAPDRVSAAEVFAALRGDLSAPVAEDPFLSLLRQRDLEVQRVFGGITLKTLSEDVDDHHFAGHKESAAK
jgi:hypothetical protein